MTQDLPQTNEIVNLSPAPYFTSVGQEIYNNFDTISNYQNTYNTDINFIGNGYENAKVLHENSQSAGSIKSKSKHIGNLISSSLFVLNDEELIPELSQESNNSSVKYLSRNQSICSVSSLTKTYKNLDFNSFKENNAVEENNCLDNTHRIPERNDFLNLFQNNNCEKFERNVAMSTEFGDIGFHFNYSDYIKGLGNVDDITGDEEIAFNSILRMYPNVNKEFIKIRKSKLNF